MNQKRHVDWNAVADDYHKRMGDIGDIYHRTYFNPAILSLLGAIEKQQILDLGCGQGYFSRLLAQRGAVVTGIDVSEKLLRFAKTREAKEPLGIRYYHNNADSLVAVPSASQDSIVANMVFHGVDTIDTVFQECARVVKNNGKFIFSLPHPLVEIAERKKDKQGYYVVLRNYRKSKEIPHSLYEDKGYKQWYRPIGFYINLLTKNNFLLSAMEEIYTKHRKGKAIKEEAMLQHKQEFPSFLVIAAVKPLDF